MIKQAPRAWNARIDSYLHQNGFTKCDVNPQDEIPFEPTIKLKPTQESQKSSQEDLDPLKSCFKNLNLVRTPQRVCL
jgi:hypothetical protein